MRFLFLRLDVDGSREAMISALQESGEENE